MNKVMVMIVMIMMTTMIMITTMIMVRKIVDAGMARAHIMHEISNTR